MIEISKLCLYDRDSPDSENFEFFDFLAFIAIFVWKSRKQK